MHSPDTDTEIARRARVDAAGPEMIARGRLVLSLLDARPDLTERIDDVVAKQIAALRVADAEGRPSIYAYQLRHRVPGLHALLPVPVVIP